jgi:membrane dipeptidase
MFTIDAHLDLSMNAMEWKCDLRKSVDEINAREKGSKRNRIEGTQLYHYPG